MHKTHKIETLEKEIRNSFMDYSLSSMVGIKDVWVCISPPQAGGSQAQSVTTEQSPCRLKEVMGIKERTKDVGCAKKQRAWRTYSYHAMMLKTEKDNVNREDGCAGLPGTAVGWTHALKGGRGRTGNVLVTKSWVLEGKRTCCCCCC